MIEYVGTDRVVADVREIGRDLGYAVAVHGSLRPNRDIDLIACPWTSKARAMSTLVRRVGELHYLMLNPALTFPQRRAHGRCGWAFLIRWRDKGTPAYVDLSVMPLHCGRRAA